MLALRLGARSRHPGLLRHHSARPAAPGGAKAHRLHVGAVVHRAVADRLGAAGRRHPGASDEGHATGVSDFTAVGESLLALRVRSVDGPAPSRHSVRTLCRRRRVSLSQRVSSSTVAGGSQAAARCVWADVAPTQDTDRVLQGQRPPRTAPQPSGRLSRLLVPAEAVDESLGEDVCQLQSGHQPSGRHGDPSDYSRLAARLSHRQTDR